MSPPMAWLRCGCTVGVIAELLPPMAEVLSGLAEGHSHSLAAGREVHRKDLVEVRRTHRDPVVDHKVLAEEPHRDFAVGRKDPMEECHKGDYRTLNWGPGLGYKTCTFSFCLVGSLNTRDNVAMI